MARDQRPWCAVGTHTVRVMNVVDEELRYETTRLDFVSLSLGVSSGFELLPPNSTFSSVEPLTHFRATVKHGYPNWLQADSVQLALALSSSHFLLIRAPFD